MSIVRMTDLDLTGKRVLIRQDLNVPVADGKVTLGPIASTRMACADMAAETAYLQMLQVVDQMEETPGQLVLSGAGHTLSFIRPIE